MLFLVGSILISNEDHVNSYSSNYDETRGVAMPRENRSSPWMFMHARFQKENHGRHFSNRIGEGGG